MGMLKKNRSSRSEDRDSGSRQIIAVDIGSTTLRMIAGSVSDDGAVTVTGYREVPSAGMYCGAVSDMKALSGALSALQLGFENTFGLTVKSCTAGLAGSFVSSANEKSWVSVQKTVSEEDKDRSIEGAKMSFKLQPNYSIIHVIPRYFIVGNNMGIVNPVGLSASRLEVSVHIIAVESDQVTNFSTALQQVRSEMQLDRVVYNGLAAAEAVLPADDREIGVCLVDIGGDTVDVALYNNSRLEATFGIDSSRNDEVAGGNAITRAIARTFGLPLHVAEVIKKDCGKASPEYLTPKEYRTVLNVPLKNSDGSVTEIKIKYVQLCEVIAKQLTEMFSLIFDRLTRLQQESGSDMSAGEGGLSLNLGAGFVLTGGGAELTGIDSFASRLLQQKYKNGEFSFKVRQGQPRRVSDATGSNFVNGPAMAVSVGLLRCASAEIRSQAAAMALSGGKSGLFGRVAGWLKSELF